ncbi:MAG: ABC transporter substrate-binding protein [Oscillospiraceae bacterium]|jgi:putative ABC transport system substrate-binding protein|nr:ABC transporter substrate-binding protein [Oscillospiraceae bacterium]
MNFALLYNYDTFYRRNFGEKKINKTLSAYSAIYFKMEKIYMKNNKKFWWLLIPSCLIIFTLIWQNFGKNREKNLKIGILQFVEHEALDASRNGFIDGLKELDFNGKIDYKNAQSDQANCTLIANQFVSEGCDLIVAIATPAAQAVATVTSEIPILVTAVTNPEDAGLVKSNEKPGTNVTGTSDLAPIAKQIGLIKQLKPEAKKVGILFSSNEANSKYQAKIAVTEAEKIGLTPQIFTFSQMMEIQQIVESMRGKVDAIYTPTDNTVASNMELIAKTALQGNLPVICGEVNLISKGAAGTFGMDYYELGKLTAKQAVDILKGGKKPENMPIEYLENVKLALNHEVLNKLKLTAP